MGTMMSLNDIEVYALVISKLDILNRKKIMEHLLYRKIRLDADQEA